jgi:hypothetical protein
MLRHCWKKIKDYPKCETIYVSYKKSLEGPKKRGKDSSVIDLEEGSPSIVGRAVRPRGKIFSKQVLKCGCDV